MEETNYEELKLKDENEEGKTVLITQSADRPNAFNSYRESKQTAADVKAMFDRPFLYVKNKFNALIDFIKGRDEAIDKKLEEQDEKLEEQDEKLEEQDEKVNEVYEAYESGELKGDAYVITEADKQYIAGLLMDELDGNDIPYTGEGVSEDG